MSSIIGEDGVGLIRCLRDYVTGNKASVEAILFALTAVCDPSETLIRALDVYMLHTEMRLLAARCTS